MVYSNDESGLATVPDEPAGNLSSGTSRGTDDDGSPAGGHHSAADHPHSAADHPPADPAAQRAGRGYRWIAAAIVLIGAALRVRVWLAGRGLWLDELAVAHDIRARGFRGLTHPLDLNQSGPVGWLWAERTAYQVLGSGERGLRLVPLIYGIGLLVLVAWLARRLVPAPAACGALALVALQPYLIAFSNELKQYSSEAFWVIAVLAAAVWMIQSGPRRRTIAVFWAVAAVGATMSMMAIPVAALAGLGLGLWLLRAKLWRRLAEFAVGGAVWLAVALVLYVRVLRPAQHEPSLKAYWAHAYPTEPLTHLSADLHWLGHTTAALGDIPFAIRYPWLVAVLALAGTALCWQRRSPVLPLLLLTPVLIGFAAAAKSIYPMADRLALFAVVPSVLILVWLTGRPPGRSGRRTVGVWAVFAALVLAIVVPQLDAVGAATAHPLTGFKRGGGANLADYRDPTALIGRQRGDSDLVVGTFLSWEGLDWYSPQYRIVPDGYLTAGSAGCTSDALPRLLAGHPRVWLFEATDWDSAANARLAGALARYGQATTYDFPHARLVRVDLSATPPSAPGLCVTVQTSAQVWKAQSR